MIAWLADGSREVLEGAGWDVFRIGLGLAMGVVSIGYLLGREWARRLFAVNDGLGHVVNVIVRCAFGVFGPIMAVSSALNLLT